MRARCTSCSLPQRDPGGQLYLLSLSRWLSGLAPTCSKMCFLTWTKSTILVRQLQLVERCPGCGARLMVLYAGCGGGLHGFPTEGSKVGLLCSWFTFFPPNSTDSANVCFCSTWAPSPLRLAPKVSSGTSPPPLSRSPSQCTLLSRTLQRQTIDILRTSWEKPIYW